MKITKIIHQKIQKILRISKNNLKYSFVYTGIISNLNLEINDSSITQFSYGVFILSLIALLSFINIMGYILAYYIFKQVNYETKYPRLSKFLNRYKKISIIYFTIEVILCLISLSILVLLSFLIVTASLTV